MTNVDERIVIEPQVRKHCGPIFFPSSLASPLGTIMGTGTFGLIDTGQLKLLVTAWHVIYGEGGFKEAHTKNSKCRFAFGIGDAPTSISSEGLMAMQVGEDGKRDLVTFDVSDHSGIFEAMGLEFYNLKANRPPKTINNDDRLYFVGFPAKHRVEKEKSVGHARQFFGVKAIVGQTGFCANVKRFGLNETDYGGISGAPCYVVNKNCSIRLVGFATDYTGPLNNLLTFTHVRYIMQNGSVDYMA